MQNTLNIKLLLKEIPMADINEKNLSLIGKRNILRLVKILRSRKQMYTSFIQFAKSDKVNPQKIKGFREEIIKYQSLINSLQEISKGLSDTMPLLQTLNIVGAYKSDENVLFCFNKRGLKNLKKRVKKYSLELLSSSTTQWLPGKADLLIRSCVPLLDPTRKISIDIWDFEDTICIPKKDFTLLKKPPDIELLFDLWVANTPKGVPKKTKKFKEWVNRPLAIANATTNAE